MNAVEIFQKMKETIKAVVNNYGVNEIRYGLIVFGSDSTTRITFNNSYSPDELNGFITNIPRRGGGPSFANAFKDAENLFSPNQGSRPDANKVLVLMTDKKYTDFLEDLTRGVKTLTMRNIRIIPVGIGNAADRIGLSAVASESSDVLLISKEENPKSLAKKIMEKASSGELI